MKILAWVAIAFFLVSCATSELYTSKETNDYKEYVSRYFISEEGKILIIGENNHYLLERSAGLLKIAQSNIGELLELEVSADLDVDLDENIMGYVKIRAKGPLDSISLEHAKEFGLYRKSRGAPWGGRFSSRSFKVQGVRYLAGDFKLPKTYEMSKSYKMKVRVEESKFEEVQRKIIMTPVTVVVDGISTVLVVAAIPFVVLFSIANGGENNWK